MTIQKNAKDSLADAKDLLLQDHKHLVDSFWKNEQTGEVRVNFFIGLVTAVMGGLVVLVDTDDTKAKEMLSPIMIVAFLGLIGIGTVTLLRMMKRNEASDKYKFGSDTIRQKFKDCFDGEQVLLEYFPHGRKREKGGRTTRKLGGLTHMVAAINTLLVGGVFGVSVYFYLPAIAINSAMNAFVSLLVLACAVFLSYIAWLFQCKKIKENEQEVQDNIVMAKPTHAGGIVYRIWNNEIKYLLVRPKGGNKTEWLLPKGYIEKNEEHTEAAHREVEEETGNLARTIYLIGQTEFKKENFENIMSKPEDVRVKFYLMEYLGKGKQTETRESEWFKFEEAANKLSYNKRLLFEAERKRVLFAGDNINEWN